MARKAQFTDKPISISFRPDVRKVVDEIAEEHDLSLNEVVRQLVDVGLSVRFEQLAAAAVEGEQGADAPGW